MIDAQAAGHIAEAAGKGIGLAWLLGHHGKAALKTYRARKTAKKKPLPLDEDAQIAQKAKDEDDGRLVRQAVFNQLEMGQQINDLNAMLALKESEIAQYKTLAEQYRQSANEWQQDANSWRKQARELQQEADQRHAEDHQHEDHQHAAEK